MPLLSHALFYRSGAWPLRVIVMLHGAWWIAPEEAGGWGRRAPYHGPRVRLERLGPAAAATAARTLLIGDQS